MIKIKNSMLKKMLTYFVGTLSTRMLSVLLVPIYAYFVHSSDLGDYDYVTAVANIVMPIVYIVIWEAVLKFFIKEKDGKDINSYITNVVVFYLMMSTLFIGVIGAFRIFVNTSNLWWMCAYSITLGAAYIWQFAARALGENQRYVLSGVVSSAGLIVIDFGFVLFRQLDFVGLMIASIAANAIVVILLEEKIRLASRVRLSSLRIDLLKSMLCFSMPLVINNISLWMYSGGSKVIIQNYLGSVENGLYSFASKFSILINIFSTVISMAVIEEAYSYRTVDEYRIKMKKMITIISKAYFSLVLLALPAIYILYSIAFKKTEYYPSSDYIFLLLLSALFTALSNNFGSAFQVTNNTKYISITTIVGAVVALGISLALVSRIGVFGVLIGTASGPAIMMVLRALFAKRSTGLSVDWRENLCLGGLLIFEYFVLMSYKNLAGQFAVLLCAGLVLIFVYKKEIYIIIKKIKTKGR